MADFDWNSLVGAATAIGGNALSNNAINTAAGQLNAGINSASANIGNALTAANAIAQPYLQTSSNLTPQYQQAVANNRLTAEQMQPFYDAVTKRYSAYTGAGDIAAGQLDGATQDLRGLGSAMDYYNQVQPWYAQNIQAGQNSLNPSQQIAADTANGYSYGDFQNSGEYQALQNANTQAQRQLAAQAGASGMTGSGTMAAALGNRMQENYANYFGQAQTADLAKNNSAAQQYQYLIGQGLTAQQAASQVANSMMGQDVGKATNVINALQNTANMGLNATNSAEQAYLGWGNQQMQTMQNQLSGLQNAQQLGGTMGQQLMGNYLTGSTSLANLAAQTGANNAASTLRQNQNNLASLAQNPAIINAAASLGKSVIDYVKENYSNYIQGSSVGYDNMTSAEQFYVDNGYWPNVGDPSAGYYSGFGVDPSTWAGYDGNEY